MWILTHHRFGRLRQSRLLRGRSRASRSDATGPLTGRYQVNLTADKSQPLFLVSRNLGCHRRRRGVIPTARIIRTPGILVAHFRGMHPVGGDRLVV